MSSVHRLFSHRRRPPSLCDHRGSLAGPPIDDPWSPGARKGPAAPFSAKPPHRRHRTSTPAILRRISVRSKPWVSTPSPPGSLCARFRRPWRTLGAQAPRSGELCRRRAASPPRNPLRASHRLPRPTCSLSVPRSCSRTQIRVESGPGTPLAVFSGRAPPRELCSGEPRRRPHAPSPVAARSRNSGPD